MTEASDFKKVLIIVHLPRSSPRIAGMVKYLPEFGWQPIILTGTTTQYKDLPARIIETPYRNALGRLGNLFKFKPDEDIRRQIKDGLNITSRKSILDLFLNFASEVINYPCLDKNWMPYAIEAGRKLLQNERIDALFSTSQPIISHLIAKQLKTEFKMPWLADLRDLWSQNANYGYSRLRRAFDRRLEIKTLAKADALITVSEPLAEKLRRLHTEKPVYAVPPGFDLAQVNDPPSVLSPKFTLTYTGTIYTGKQDPAKLLIAIKDLIAEGTMKPEEVEVKFYGLKSPALDKESKRYGLKEIIRQYGVVPQAVALEKQRESQALILFDWDDPKEKGVYTCKIFEYLGARRPIIATGGVKGNVIDSLLAETGAGVHAPAAEDIKKALQKMYQEYKQSGQVSYRGNISKIDKFSHREMARRFAEILAQAAE
ncbi:MAG: glycosyltransferase [Dehalococcoidales bacterium]